MHKYIITTIVASAIVIPLALYAAGMRDTGYASLTHGSVLTIDTLDGCRKVTAGGGSSRFIPTKNRAGWDSFVAHAPLKATIVADCYVAPITTKICGTASACSTLAGSSYELDGRGYYSWGGERGGKFFKEFTSDPTLSATKICEGLGKQYFSHTTYWHAINCGVEYTLTYYRNDIGGFKSDSIPICIDTSRRSPTGQFYQGQVDVIDSITCQ